MATAGQRHQRSGDKGRLIRQELSSSNDSTMGHGLLDGDEAGSCERAPEPEHARLLTPSGWAAELRYSQLSYYLPIRLYHGRVSANCQCRCHHLTRC